MRSPWTVVLLAQAALLPGCGTASGGRAASLAGDVVGRALSGSGASEKPSAWSLNSARCGLFSEHGMACPTLRNCAALFGTAESGLTLNVCVDDMGDLDPIKWCTYGSKWCRATEFPKCETAQRWACDDFESIVCENPEGRRRILRNQVDPLSGQCAYELAKLREEPDAQQHRATDGTYDDGSPVPTP